MTTIDRDISPDFRKRVPIVNLVTPPAGVSYYALIRAEYVPDGASRFGPDHHILVDVWGVDGQREINTPVNFTYPSGTPVVVLVNKVGVPYGADHALFNHGYVVGCWVGTDRAASDYVQGMGLGKIGSENIDEHVTYYLIFQRQDANTVPTEPPVEPPTSDHAALEAIRRIVDAQLG